jgi:alanyl-tRNA synthetase
LKYGITLEFNRKADGSLEKCQHVDTGMGFERLWQCKTPNYDTDVFTPLIQKWRKLQD